MSSPTPDIEARKQQWHTRHRELETQLSDSGLMRGLIEVRQRIREHLFDELRRVREGGYRFAADLEETLRALSRRADDAERVLSDHVRRAVGDLRWKADQLRDSFRRLDVQSFGDPTFSLSRLDSDLDDLARDLDAVKRRVAEAVSDLPQQADALASRLAVIGQYLARSRSASFSLDPGECLFLAVEAEWKKTGRKSDDPDGILHVTDRRILMERREKEGGILGLGGKAVQQLLWEIPWSDVETLRAEQRGLLGGIDLIHFRLKPSSPLGVPELTVEIKGGLDADAFADQLRVVLSGDLERQRVAVADRA